MDQVRELFDNPNDRTQHSLFEFDARLFMMLTKKFGGECTLNQLRVANAIMLAHHSRSPFPSNAGMALKLGMPKSTVSNAIANLIASGHVFEMRDPDDRRKTTFRPAEKMLDRMAELPQPCHAFAEIAAA